MEELRRGPINFFIYLAILVSLIIFCICSINLMFGVIDYYFTSNLKDWVSDYEFGVFKSFPSYISFYVFSFLALAYLSKKANNIEIAFKIDVWATLSRLIVMLIITISSLVSLTFLAFVFTSFLEGDVVFNTFLAFISTVVFASIVAYYYINVLKDKWNSSSFQVKKIIWGIWVLFFILLFLAFTVANPLQKSALNTTYANLRSASVTQGLIVDYLSKYGATPANLSVLTSGKGYLRGLEKEVKYTRINSSTYSICIEAEAFPKRINHYAKYPYFNFPIKNLGENCYTFRR